MAAQANNRVLSIQSHVVHGYVGNKCAIFPLQLHGFEVDFINSVQFSNHTGYKHWKGQVLSSEELGDLLHGLHLNNLDTEYTHVLTGYIADEGFLKKLAQAIGKFREKNPKLLYICDPVLGDGNEYYVSKALMPLYRSLLIPLANIITPNQFELGQLAKISIDSEATCVAAIKELHKLTDIIVVTSTDLCPKPDFMYGYGSVKNGNKFRFQIKCLEAKFLGTGDLFTTLLLIWYTKCQKNLKQAVRNTLSSMHDLLNFTLIEAQKAANKQGLSSPSSKNVELRLIQGQTFLLNPTANIEIVDLVA